MKGETVGGLLHWVHNGKISRCFTTGSVEAPTFSAAGFIVENYGGVIEDCWTRCSVIGPIQRAGFVRYNGSGAIRRSYSAGLISEGYRDGFCDSNYATIDDCFWDIEVSGHTSSNGGT
ncbi:unnamed protein product, partial [marine sediment metagenome]